MKRDLPLLIATGFGLGHLPRAPGTWGALGAVLFYLILAPFLNFWGYFFISLFFCAVGVWSAQKAAETLAQRDPREVVIDEIAGQWIALWSCHSLGAIFWSFIVFRLLDIYKPPPIRQVDQLPGGWGIMADDVVAGILTGLLLFFVRLLIRILAEFS